MKKPTVAIVYHYFAHYREPVLNELAGSTKYHYRLISDLTARNTSIKTLDREYFETLDRENRSLDWKRVRNHWFGPLLWQSGLLKQVLDKEIDSVIYLGDAFFASTWVGSILGRCRGKRVFYWTHGIYGRESLLKLLFRCTFYRLANAGLLLYGNYAKNLLIQRRFSSDKLYNIYNSLDYKQQKKLRTGLNRDIAGKVRQRLFGENAEYPIAFFVGRLTREKKLGLLIDAFLELHATGQKLNLLFVGGGPEEPDLRARIPAELESHVHFFGACHDENLLAEMIYAAHVCVSPGNIGLTAIHSLAYGTPVVTHDDGRWQGPEFEAVKNDFSGTLFARDNLTSLVNAMQQWLFLPCEMRENIRLNCFQVIDQHYNPANQVRIIEQALDGVRASQICPP